MLTSGKHALTESAILTEAVSPTTRGGAARAWLMADAAWRLGPRACLLAARHRLLLRSGLAARALADVALPAGRLLPHGLAGDGLPGDAAALAAAAEAAVAPGWHGPFPADASALGLDLFAPGDIRPVWEANRLLALPLLAKAARLAPAGQHLARAEAVLRGWAQANPPFRGPAWACGQEAALRALHLCLALALLEADQAPSPAMRALLSAHARRIEATRAYAAAQDNNHAVSEPAGLFVIGLVLGDAAMAARGARDLARAIARLVAPDGAFAQASPGYHRLLLDTLVVAEWFRRRHGAPAFAAPFAERAAAATLWLWRVMDPATGALPRCGAVDDSALADLSLHGALDARGSVGRAVALFRRGASSSGLWWGGPEGQSPVGETAPRWADGPERGFAPLRTSPHQRLKAFGNLGFGALPQGVVRWPWGNFGRCPQRSSTPPPDHRTGIKNPRSRGPLAPGGVVWRGKAPPIFPPPEPPPGESTHWRSEGWLGQRTPRFHLLLRTGAPMRFRPSQADLLHLDLALDGAPLLIDGGTGAYNPPPGSAWWRDALAGTAGHNTVQFDGRDQMPRVGRFLFACWPRCRAVPGGAALRDTHGNRHERRIRLTADTVMVEDRVAGRFARLVLRWRLAPGEWRFTDDGAVGPSARLRLSADAPCRIRLAQSWHSPAYGRVEPAPVLELAAAAPVSRLTTLVEAA